MRSRDSHRTIRRHSGASVCISQFAWISLIRRFRFFVLAGAFSGALVAQTPGNLDCSDPLLAGTLECSSQNQSQATRGNQSQVPSEALAGYGAITENPSIVRPSSNYSDIEQIRGSASRQTVPLPPEPLTEFQKFVASTTGQILPIYGADLFRRIPSTFAPLDLAPVPSDYVIGPGDELRIRVWGQVNQQANVRVDRSGDIYLPQVGQLHVAGLADSELDQHLREAVGRVFRNFDLSADIGQIRAIQVYVTGEARRPGVYTVSSLSTLVDALFSSGGPSVEGSLRSIELRRGGVVITRFDLYDLLIKGDRSKDAKLLSGDVIFIPPAGPEAAIFGSVRNPSIYELRPQESLSDALTDAGGVSSVAAEARISIERIDEHRERHAMQVEYSQTGLTLPAADGDVIRVSGIVPKYDKTVTLRGNIADPGRFAWHEGMRISELIPDKESLLTRDYWWRRAQMGLPAPEFEPMDGLANQRQPIDNQPVTLDLLAAESRAAGSQSGLSQTTGMNSPGQQTPDPATEQSVLEQGQPGFSVSSVQSGFSTDRSLNLSAQQRAGSATLASTQATVPGRTLLQSQRTEVQLPAPEIDWDYAVIERLDPATLKTELLPFDLGKLILNNDASQDLELQPGDVISIFSEADIHIPVAEQTKLVRLEGEFVHAGVYSVRPGETLRQLVERAGGLTPNAYLYGSEFTRESARAVQQARIDEYVQSLSLQVQRSTVALATSPSALTQSLANGSAAQNSMQSILTSLRQIHATGRIVLQVQPDAAGVESLPDIALEDGDRFSIPHTPAIVNVVGAVYDQNSFLFKTDSRAGTYLRLAGGLNKDADRRREFIIRADGDVVSYDMTNGPWGSEFNDRHIYPGDTIVVPEKILKPSALYGVMNWSQMFSQFALGAAAIDVIR